MADLVSEIELQVTLADEKQKSISPEDLVLELERQLEEARAEVAVQAKETRKPFDAFLVYSHRDSARRGFPPSQWSTTRGVSRRNRLKWVEAELAYFLQARKQNKILAVLAAMSAHFICPSSTQQDILASLNASAKGRTTAALSSLAWQINTLCFNCFTSTF